MKKFLLLGCLALCSMTAQAYASSVPLTDSRGEVEFTLQVGSFGTQSEATALSSRIPDAWVQPVRQNGKTLFRVNYKRFGDRNQAVRAQWDLEDLGFKGFVQRLYT